VTSIASHFDLCHTHTNTHMPTHRFDPMLLIGELMSHMES